MERFGTSSCPLYELHNICCTSFTQHLLTYSLFKLLWIDSLFAVVFQSIFVVFYKTTCLVKATLCMPSAILGLGHTASFKIIKWERKSNSYPLSSKFSWILFFINLLCNLKYTPIRGKYPICACYWSYKHGNLRSSSCPPSVSICNSSVEKAPVEAGIQVGGDDCLHRNHPNLWKIEVTILFKFAFLLWFIDRFMTQYVDIFYLFLCCHLIEIVTTRVGKYWKWLWNCSNSAWYEELPYTFIWSRPLFTHLKPKHSRVFCLNKIYFSTF